jgi:hypothetical protein
MVSERLRPSQTFAEQPDRFRVGHRAVPVQPQKPHERQAVANLVFRLVVGQIVQRLQHQNLKHQNVVERRAASGVAVFALQCLLQRLAEILPRIIVRNPSSGSPARLNASYLS